MKLHMNSSGEIMPIISPLISRVLNALCLLNLLTTHQSKSFGGFKGRKNFAYLSR